jgi:hypothetical protein
MATPAQLPSRVKIRRAEAGLKKARKEIRKLTAHMKKGTLHRNKLDSGLKNLTRVLAKIPTHRPFSPSG